MNSPELSPRFPSADRVFVIAEIGTSHQGDPVKAEELIDAAAESGADCAKFQMVIADEICTRKPALSSFRAGPSPCTSASGRWNGTLPSTSR
jgi:sialic acid synthase SpsE